MIDVSIIWFSAAEKGCARRVLTGGDNPSEEHYDFISAMASYAVETGEPLNVNFDAAERALNNYLHDYNAISILRAACSKTLASGENQDEKCGSHSLDFYGSAFFSSPEVSSNADATEQMQAFKVA